MLFTDEVEEAHVSRRGGSHEPARTAHSSAGADRNAGRPGCLRGGGATAHSRGAGLEQRGAAQDAPAHPSGAGVGGLRPVGQQPAPGSHLQRHPPGLLGGDRLGRAPRPDGLLRPGAASWATPPGIALATLLTACAVSTRIGTDLLETLSSMFNPLPAIALLPLALLWFGLGNPSLMFVMVHSVLWPVALNTHSGFRAVSNTLRMVGQNCGLTRRPLHPEDPHPSGIPQHSHRSEDRLGVRLAHADRCRTGLRGQLRPRRAGLVHLREQEPARSAERLRGALLRDPHRSRGGEPGLPQHRAAHRATLGDADVTGC